MLLGASKGVAPEIIDLAAEAGLAAVGENRVQEFEGKLREVTAALRWDFIGALQRNKVRKVVGRVRLIHGIDDAELLAAVSAAATAVGVTQEILIEVNVSGEVTKAGCSSDDVGSLAAAALASPGVRLRGLMTIAAFGDTEGARRSFRELRDLGEGIRPGLDGPLELSMGMSDDFEVAVEEGATIVRVGKAIFGQRQA